ncbi:MAG: hypothetical protein RBR23_03680 [Arcobacteraceae bacterium]|jgi:hypothetical protein|nr:hypothetical protein [Arcobacteraceae bacterium]
MNIVKYVFIALLSAIVFYGFIEGIKLYTQLKAIEVKDHLLLHQMYDCIDSLEKGNQEDFKECVDSLRKMKNFEHTKDVKN